MIREFNYTQRKRIEFRHLRIELVEPVGEGSHSFNLTLDLADLQLPQDAPLVAEASRRNSVMRFHWGTVGQPQAPPERELSDVPLVPNFRVMALSPDDSHRILAMADRVKPTWKQAEALGASELICLAEKDLGQEVWQLDLGEGEDVPVLRVNSNIDGISRTVRQDPTFRSLVFPEVLRTILTNALLIQGANPGDEAGYWHGWFGFVSQFYGKECPGLTEVDPDEDRQQEELREWINGAVTAFTDTRFNASKLYAEAKG